MPDRDPQAHEIELAVVPDGFRHIELGSAARVDPALSITREGDCFVAEVDAFDETHSMARNHLHVDEQMVHVRPGDRIPLILAYRRSMMEFASATDAYRLTPGDTIFIDDLQVNLTAASSLGIRTVRFIDSAQCRQELVDLDCI